MKIRIQKFISSQGVLSRRAAEAALKEGRLAVNGNVVTELGFQINPDCDEVTLDGKIIQASRAEAVTILLNKPKKVVTTKNDPEGRKTVMDLLPDTLQFLNPVGRLDFESEGLLLLTSDGIFQQKATHPKFGVIKKYLVQVAGQPNFQHFLQWKTGVLLKEPDGALNEGKFLDIQFSTPELFTKFKFKKIPNESVLEISVNEGRNRFVRRMCSAQGFPVHRLLRYSLINPNGEELLLENLQPGCWRYLTPQEMDWIEKVKKIV